MTERSSAVTVELLPCPFCGGSRVGMASSIDATEWAVLCSDCGASCSTTCESHDEAVNSWNARVPAQQTPAKGCWTPEQGWEYVEGLTDAHTRDCMREMLAIRGLSLSSTPSGTEPSVPAASEPSHAR